MIFDKLLFATGNKGKLKEASEIFSNVKIISVKELDPDFNPEETGESFLQNVIIKAERALELTDKIPVLADDSGLVVPALGGQPGLYSARFSGNDATDESNRAKLLEMMKGVDERSAYFCCRAVLMFNDKSLVSAEGRVYGKIGYDERGNNGFGYDPIFTPAGFTNTMAELSSYEKNKISHRGNALRKLWEIVKCLQNFQK